MKKYKFTAELRSVEPAGACVFFPYDVQAEFGTKGRVPVQATINGLPYTGSLIKYGNPLHMLPVLKAIRTEAGVTPGDTVEVELWRDEQIRTLEVPDDLQQQLESSGMLTIFEGLSYTHRKEYCRWITDAKKPETRTRRLEKAVEMLKAGTKTPDGPKGS